MDKLKVRVYNVRFGDCILLSVPDRDDSGNPLTRHILVDFGNVSSGEGGENEAFRPAIDDILGVLAGNPLDLLVITHEHLDHVQGFLWAAKKAYPTEDFSDKLNVGTVWLPASAQPDYYDTHPEAKKKLEEAGSLYFAIQRFLRASPETDTDRVRALMRNNNRFLGIDEDAEGLSHARTADCMEYIRKLTGTDHVHYVHRSVALPPDDQALFDIGGAHPFKDAEFEIWAPEEDTSVYYGHFKPVVPLEFPAAGSGESGAPDQIDIPGQPTPPPGVDAGAFYNLVELRRTGYIDNLLAIDKAANNSSIVFCLKWRGWRLLFPGDAEIRSWKEMNKRGVLKEVDFLKVSHHASHSGTPEEKILKKFLPETAAPLPDRHAVVSTYLDTYERIPHEPTIEELKDKHGCTIHSTLGKNDGEPLIIELTER